MNKKTKTEQLEELFAEWQKHQETELEGSRQLTMLKDAKIVSYNSFCKDGIICEEEFEKQDVKLLFVANEPNIENEEYIKKLEEGEVFQPVTSQIESFYEYYNNENHYDKWGGKLRQRICEIIYPAMLEPNESIFPVENGWVNAKKIAFMNLNKRGGKGEIESHLKYYCKEYAKEIIEEIDIIKPDVIVWLGIDSFYMCSKALFGNNCEEIDDSCFILKTENHTIPLILTHHTSSRISSQKRGDIVRVSYDNYKKSVIK